jgi:hypothetical protein
MQRQQCRFVVALAVCVLVPVTTASAQKQISRPFRMAAHSQAVISMVDYSVVAHAEGVASHMGEVTADASGYATDPVTYGTMTTANGDVMYWAQAAGSDVVTITGGTGRFEGASGQFTLVVLMDGPPIVDPVAGTMTMNYIWTASGTITY